jgi:hypothetical protein
LYTVDVLRVAVKRLNGDLEWNQAAKYWEARFEGVSELNLDRHRQRVVAVIARSTGETPSLIQTRVERSDRTTVR